jgi:hypothetical protein
MYPLAHKFPYSLFDVPGLRLAIASFLLMDSNSRFAADYICGGWMLVKCFNFEIVLCCKLLGEIFIVSPLAKGLGTIPRVPVVDHSVASG